MDFESATVIRTDTGDKLDLTIDSPAFVTQQITQAVRRFIDKEIETEFPALGAKGTGPITSGFRKILRNHKKVAKLYPKWDNQCRAAPQSATSNGQWTQDRLVRAGLSKCNLCKLCLKEGGTPKHRHKCEVTAAARGECTQDKACETFLRQLKPVN